MKPTSGPRCQCLHLLGCLLVASLARFATGLRLRGEDDIDEQQGQSFCSVGHGWKHDWKDDFDGNTLDSASWEVITSTGGIGNVATVGGLNVTACRSAQCRRENLRVTGGALRILTERNATTGMFSSGAVTTRNRRAWADETPYRMCIRAQLPGASGGPSARGIWPAHWMLPDNDICDKCLDEGEVDIMEMINGDGNVHSVYHWMASFPEQKCADYDKYHRIKETATTLRDWGESFHEYAVERSKGHLVFAVDGRVVLRVRPKDGVQLNSTNRNSRLALSHTPFFLILNTAVGGSWPGEPTRETMNRTEHIIDYVHVVRRSEGEGMITEEGEDADQPELARLEATGSRTASNTASRFPPQPPAISHFD